MLWFNSDSVTSAQTESTHSGYECVWVCECVFKWNCLIRHKHIYSVEYLLNNLIWNPAPLHITLAVLQSRRTRTRRNNRSRQTNEAPNQRPTNPSDWHSSSSTDVSNFLDLNTFNKSESGQTIQTERRRRKTRRKKISERTRANGFSNDPINLKQKSCKRLNLKTKKKKQLLYGHRVDNATGH